MKKKKKKEEIDERKGKYQGVVVVTGEWMVLGSGGDEREPREKVEIERETGGEKP